MIESKLIQTSICEIRKTLEAFAACPKTQEKLDDGRYRCEYHTKTYWTPNVIRLIGCIGKKDFEVYSKFHRHKYSADKGWHRTDKTDSTTKGEWSYDLCWVEEHNRMTESLPLTKNLPLALECEWDNYSTNNKYNIKIYRSEIEFDFEKLLRSCAALRVMIFDCWCPNEPADVVKDRAKVEIDNLIRRIKAFSGPQSEATYLFCVHCVYKKDGNKKGGNEFVFCHYTHPPTAEN